MMGGSMMAQMMEANGRDEGNVRLWGKGQRDGDGNVADGSDDGWDGRDGWRLSGNGWAAPVPERKGIDKRNVNTKEVRTKKEEAVKNSKGVTLFDPYFDIVQVTVYGQARFFNAPPAQPAAEPSPGEVTAAAAPSATAATPAGAPAAPASRAGRPPTPRRPPVRPAPLKVPRRSPRPHRPPNGAAAKHGQDRGRQSGTSSG